jgi:hypothetical protein
LKSRTTTVVTICSANYLAHAKTLGDSLLQHNPEVHFVIGLVDRMPAGLDASFCPNAELLPVEQVGITDLPLMLSRYNLVELNTAVKPFYMSYLYQRDPEVKNVIYFDPDILIFGSLTAMEAELKNNSIILTPHSNTSDDSPENIRSELAMISTGTFNLGFVATSRSPVTERFLAWWKLRMRDYCYYKPGHGLFVDQIWANLVPLYFDGVKVEKHPGWNTCYWNLFERSLSRETGGYKINGLDLLFYHFSSYSPLAPEFICKRPPTIPLAARPELKALFEDYQNRLLSNGFMQVKDIKWAFEPQPVPLSKSQQTQQNIKRTFQGCLRGMLGLLPSALRTRLGRFARFIGDNSPQGSL